MEDAKLDDITVRKIADIFKQESEIDRLTGRKFNIFEITEIENKEVKICLVLSHLLDPKGSHGQGGIFLEKFCRTVLNLDPIELSKDELERAKVIKEYSIPKTKRRIDIVIITSGHFIPIEVKIKAGDEKGQCYDYYKEACDRMGKNAAVFYLTPKGKAPSEKSLTEELSKNPQNITDKYGKGKIRRISFKDDISAFLSECIDDSRIKTCPYVCEILVQLLSTVRTISECGYTSELEKKINEVIPKEIDRNKLSENMKKYFLRKTLEGFLEKENKQKDDKAIVDEIEESHNWKYRISDNIGETTNGEKIIISINVDVHEKNAYWGMTLWTDAEHEKKYYDTLMQTDSRVKEIIDEKIGEYKGRKNTWIFKENRWGIFNPERIDLYRLLIPSELDALIKEVVSDVDRIYKDYRSINDVK